MDRKNIELKVYRHKTHKDMYLVRNSCCGGSETTQFYNVTNDVLEAIKSYNYHKKNFMCWFRSFPNNKTTTKLIMDFEWDGYKGKLTKEIELPISEFELVSFVEE